MNKRFFLFLVLLNSITSAITGQIPENHTSKSTGLNNGSINCFVYHRFGDDRYPSTNISVELFRKHLEYLKSNQFNLITFGEAAELLKKGATIPEKTVCLTVDDGYTSFYKNALPLLKEFNFPATLFINTKQFGTGDFLTIQQLKEIATAGVEIGNHSHSHAQFVNFTESERRDTFLHDLEMSHHIFNNQLEIEPTVFAYPYGEYTSELQQVLNSYNYIGAAAQKSGVISVYSDKFALPRFPMAGPFANLESFIRKANMKSLPTQPINKTEPLLQENPPTLLLKLFEPDKINTSQLQCFVGGQKNCVVEYNANQNVIKIWATKPLQARRTLYTVTGPDAANSDIWYWYSYLWIDPSIEE